MKMINEIGVFKERFETKCEECKDKIDNETELDEGELVKEIIKGVLSWKQD